ncbi:MAG: hypothetical protein GEU80_15635 [Dehalococcoidia bacterium]|nr:hypothetical protein [Dehalococcoidia bacterium]
MTSDPTGGLHYSRDDRDPVSAPELTYSNPHRQRVGPRWVRGEVVWAMPLGIVHVEPEQTTWAKEYVVVYSLDGNDGRPERVPDQYGIYDTRPGDEHYSPIWSYHYVLVPRDYEPNALRSEDDVLASGYEVVQADTYTN